MKFICTDKTFGLVCMCRVPLLGVPKSRIKPFYQPRLSKAAREQLSVSPEAGSVSNLQQVDSLPLPRPRYKVSDAGSSSTHPALASDATLPLARSRPPMTSPTSLRRLTGQARRDRSQITTPSPITAWGRAAGHYAANTGTIRMIRVCVAYEAPL
jgi:hypothetical protein